MASLLELHDRAHEQIKELDTQLDSLLDPKTAGKTRLINERVEANKEGATQVVTNIVDLLKDSSIDAQIGMYYAIIKGMHTAFKQTADDHLEKLVENLPKTEPMITEEQAKEALAKRNEMATNLNGLIDMATAMGDEEAKNMYPAPKRSGRTGPRGKRAISDFSFKVGNKEYDSLKEVAKDYSQYYDSWGALSAAIRGDKPKLDEAGNPVLGRKSGQPMIIKGTNVDLSDPPDTFSFVLPNGDVLVATRDEEIPEDPNDPEDEAAES